MRNNLFGSLARPLAFFVILLAHTDATVLALENQTCLQGYKACWARCNANRTGAQEEACVKNCAKYWFCNGSDAKDHTADCTFYGGTPAASIQGNPTTPKPINPGLTTGRTPQQTR